jgi:hypothetical protein
MKVLLLAVTLALAAAPQQATKKEPTASPVTVEAKYDRFKDVTVITIEPQIVFEQPAVSRLVFAAHAAYPGKVKAADYNVSLYLIFAAASTDAEFVGRNPALYVLADEERVNLGTASLTDSKTTETYAANSYLLTLTPTAARKIFKADRVEMQFGGVEFTIKDNLRDAMRNLLAQL